MKAFVGFMNLLVDHNYISQRVPQQPVDQDRGGGGVEQQCVPLRAVSLPVQTPDASQLGC